MTYDALVIAAVEGAGAFSKLLCAPAAFSFEFGVEYSVKR
jgi:hypothetical protein